MGQEMDAAMAHWMAGYGGWLISDAVRSGGSQLRWVNGFQLMNLMCVCRDQAANDVAVLLSSSLRRGGWKALESLDLEGCHVTGQGLQSLAMALKPAACSAGMRRLGLAVRAVGPPEMVQVGRASVA